MKLVVPYAPGRLNEYVPAVLSSYGHSPQFVELHGDHGYSDLLKTLWAEGETFVLVEQDVLPWPGAVEELHNCVGLWCSCSYIHNGAHGLYHMLGCTKVSARLIGMLPHVWDKPVHWTRCDTHLYHEARALGQDPHPHRPPVVHLHPRES